MEENNFAILKCIKGPGAERWVLPAFAHDATGAVVLADPLRSLMLDVLTCYMLDAEDRINGEAPGGWPSDPGSALSGPDRLIAMLAAIDDLTDWLARPFRAELVAECDAMASAVYTPVGTAPADDDTDEHVTGGEG